jgi:hypothetical protein
MIAALTALALLLLIGEAIVIHRAIARHERQMQAISEEIDAEAAGLLCRRCGRTLRPGLLSPYPRPCPCPTRRPLHVSI